jgi:hypothetical protein
MLLLLVLVCTDKFATATLLQLLLLVALPFFLGTTDFHCYCCDVKRTTMLLLLVLVCTDKYALTTVTAMVALVNESLGTR